MSNLKLATPDDVGHLVRSLVAAAVRCDVYSLDTTAAVHTFGLDSLEAAAISRRLGDALGSTVSMTVFLGDRSIDEISDELLNRDSDAALIPAAASAASGQLSHGQKALWAIQQSAPASSAYNLPYAFKLNCVLDQDAMRESFARLIARHAALRTTFPIARGTPYAETTNSVTPDFQYIDKLTSGNLSQTLRDEASIPFSLSEGPLVRLRLYDVDSHYSVLLLVVHHIVTDFWSIAVILRDLFELYASQVNGRACVLPQLAGMYDDFVSRQTQLAQSTGGASDLEYWEKALGGTLSPLDLITNRQRPRQPSYHGATYRFDIDPATTDALRGLARATGCTLFVPVLSGFLALLNRYTGQDDVIVGVPTSTRDRIEMMDNVGYYVNPIAVRAQFDNDLSCRSLVTHTRKTVLRALNHQRISFPLIVEHLRPKRDPSRPPIFQSMFVWQTPIERIPQVPTALALGVEGIKFTLNDIQLETISTGGESAQFDITLSVAEHGGGLIAALKYSTDLFDQESMVRMAGHFDAILKEMSLNPDTPVSALSL